MIWHELAGENRSAAYDLFTSHRWRGCANRAYYALYSEVTHALSKAGVTMPAGRGNPSHKGLPNLVLYNLSVLSQQKRGRLFNIIAKLYGLRILSDYKPGMTLEESEARIALALMSDGFLILKDIS